MALGNSPVRDMLNCGTKLNLRTVVPTDEVVIAVFGDPDWNDSSPRFYYYDVNSSATDDGENVLKPTSVMGNGRFIKITNSQVQSDWTQSSSSAIDFIKNKPTLSTVASSGDYNDLSNKPTIPSGSVTSVGLSASPAFSVSGSPITGSGTITLSGAGNTSQYIRGDGTLATMPSSPGSVTYSAYASGSSYTLTTSSSKVDFGTTDPSITIGAAGTYLIYTNLKIDYAGVTTALNACSFKLRRTNNTAADLPNAVTTFNVPALTLASGTGGDVDIPLIVYSTLNTNDTVELWGNRSGGLTLGSINVSEASIVAVRIN